MSKQRSDEEGDVFNLFNLNDFKKWIHTQQDESPSRPHMIGVHVESKVNIKKLISRMEVQDDGEEEELAKEFKQNGGIIAEVDGPNILVEVDSGSFIIHKMYIKRNN